MFTLEKIVPWGRSFEEYEAMFLLTVDDYAGNILDCGGGPSSFNVELTARGGRVVSIDPIYAFSADDVSSQIDECFDKVVQETECNREQFVWRLFNSVRELAQARRAAMNFFLADYIQGDSRYLNGSLPSLPFVNETFDLALCSHLLFLYSDHLDLDFHVSSILELCRVAKEVRVFPLLDLSASRSPHIDSVCEQLGEHGIGTEIEKVNYEFQKGGFEMLRVMS